MKIKYFIAFMLISLFLVSCKAEVTADKEGLNWETKDLINYLKNNGLDITKTEASILDKRGADVTLKKGSITIVNYGKETTPKVNNDKEFVWGKFYFYTDSGNITYKIKVILEIQKSADSKEVKRLADVLKFKGIFWRGYLETYNMRAFFGKPKKIFFLIENTTGKSITAFKGSLLVYNDFKEVEDIIQFSYTSKSFIFKLDANGSSNEVVFKIEPKQTVIIETTDNNATSVLEISFKESLLDLFAKGRNIGDGYPVSYKEDKAKIDIKFIPETIVFEDGSMISVNK